MPRPWYFIKLPRWCNVQSALRMPGLSWAPGWRRASQGEVKAGSRNWEPWRRGCGTRAGSGGTTQVKHSDSKNQGDGRGQTEWALTSTSKGLDFMPRATESYLNRRLIGSGVYFQIFGTLLFSWNGNQGSRVVDPGGGSEGSGGQELDPTELMGCLDAGWTQGLSQRLPLALGRKKKNELFL